MALNNIYKVTKQQYDLIIAGNYPDHIYDKEAIYLVEEEEQKIDLEGYSKIQKLDSTTVEGALEELSRYHRTLVILHSMMILL